MTDGMNLTTCSRAFLAVVAPWAIAGAGMAGGWSAAAVTAVVCAGLYLAMMAFRVTMAPPPAPQLDQVLAHLPDRTTATLAMPPASRAATLAEALGTPLSDEELATLGIDAVATAPQAVHPAV